MGEASAYKKQPCDYEQNDHESSHYRTAEIAHPCHYRMSRITSETTSEEGIRGKEHRHICKDQRRYKGSADNDERSLEKAYALVPEEQAVGCSSHDENKGEAAQTKEAGHKEIGPSVSGLACGICDINALVQHIRLREEALIGRPCEQIRHGGHKGKHRKYAHNESQSLQNDRLRIRIHCRKEREAVTLLFPVVFLCCFLLCSHILLMLFITHFHVVVLMTLVLHLALARIHARSCERRS